MYDASQFGQLNRLTWDLSYTDLHNGLKKVMLTKSVQSSVRAQIDRPLVNGL
jgi:hypothetical protein